MPCGSCTASFPTNIPQARRAEGYPEHSSMRLRRLAGSRHDSRGVWRFWARPHRGFRHHGGDQPIRRQLGRLPWADVQHGHVVAARVARRRSGRICPKIAAGEAAHAVDGGDRAHDRYGHDQDHHHRGATGRPLRRERPEGLDLTRSALRSHDPARPDDSARRGEEEIGGHVDLPRRSPRGHREGAHGPPDPQHGQSRNERALLRQPRNS